MKKNTSAHVIIIGDEILYGHTLDTNSHFLAREFAKISIDLIQISAIQDDKEDIKDEILSSHADIIITTGGLGPTRDDKTKYVLSEILEQPLEMHEEALRWTQEYFERVVDRPMNVLNRNQALVPLGTIPLHNKVGTAPGLWTEMGNKILVNLPGVPFEMKYLMKNEVLPRLLKRFHPIFIHHEFVQTIDIPESELAELLNDFEHDLPNHINLAYLPRGKKIRLRLTGKGDDLHALKFELNQQTDKLIATIPDEHFLSRDDREIEKNVGRILMEKNQTVATAESFTAGAIAAALTSVSGSSGYFKGGIVAYSVELKEKLLQVDKSFAQKNGVVNKEVAMQMARGVMELTKCDVGLSSTGVAGPTADEFEIQPGVAFIAIVSHEKEAVFEFHYPHLDRKDFTKKMTEMALQKLYQFLR